jgi:hypothetical protein
VDEEWSQWFIEIWKCDVGCLSSGEGGGGTYEEVRGPYGKKV